MEVKEPVYDILSSYSELRTNVGIYNADKKVIKSIKENLEGVEIKAFKGSLLNN